MMRIPLNQTVSSVTVPENQVPNVVTDASTITGETMLAELMLEVAIIHRLEY